MRIALIRLPLPGGGYAPRCFRSVGRKQLLDLDPDPAMQELVLRYATTQRARDSLIEDVARRNRNLQRQLAGSPGSRRERGS